MDDFKVIDNYLMIRLPDEIDHHKSVDISVGFSGVINAATVILAKDSLSDSAANSRWILFGGIGIEDVGMAMEPLYTSKPEQDRSGMGFAFMEAFMDDLEVESEVG